MLTPLCCQRVSGVRLNNACLQATYAKLTWNAPGTGMLALTATDTDATNQSYYGEQKLSFLSADGTNDCMVQLKVFFPAKGTSSQNDIERRSQ